MILLLHCDIIRFYLKVIDWQRYAPTHITRYTYNKEALFPADILTCNACLTNYTKNITVLFKSIDLMGHPAWESGQGLEEKQQLGTKSCSEDRFYWPSCFT